MPTLKEIAQKTRDIFGIGTKSFEDVKNEPVGFKPKVTVVSFVKGTDEADSVMAKLKEQTYKNHKVIFVTNNPAMVSTWKEVHTYEVFAGEGFYDGALKLKELEVLATLHGTSTSWMDGGLVTEFKVDHHWQPGHLESLVALSETHVAYSQRAQLHPEAGWDVLMNLEDRVVAESILWPLHLLSCWEGPNPEEAVRKLQVTSALGIKTTAKPTLVLPALEKTPE